MNEQLFKQLAEQAAQESFGTPNDEALEVVAESGSYQVPANFILRFAELVWERAVESK